MPETTAKTRCVHPLSNSSARPRLFGQSSPSGSTRSRTRGRPEATGLTNNQEMRLRAGDIRLARLQVSLTQLRHEMDQTDKLIEQICQEAHLDMERI